MTAQSPDCATVDVTPQGWVTPRLLPLGGTRGAAGGAADNYREGNILSPGVYALLTQNGGFAGTATENVWLDYAPLST